MNCTNCGMPLPKGQLICPSCGQKTPQRKNPTWIFVIGGALLAVMVIFLGIINFNFGKIMVAKSIANTALLARQEMLNLTETDPVAVTLGQLLNQSFRYDTTATITDIYGKYGAQFSFLKDCGVGIDFYGDIHNQQFGLTADFRIKETPMLDFTLLAKEDIYSISSKALTGNKSYQFSKQNLQEQWNNRVIDSAQNTQVSSQTNAGQQTAFTQIYISQQIASMLMDPRLEKPTLNFIKNAVSTEKSKQALQLSSEKTINVTMYTLTIPKSELIDYITKCEAILSQESENTAPIYQWKNWVELNLGQEILLSAAVANQRIYWGCLSYECAQTKYETILYLQDSAGKVLANVKIDCLQNDTLKDQITFSINHPAPLSYTINLSATLTDLQNTAVAKNIQFIINRESENASFSWMQTTPNSQSQTKVNGVFTVDNKLQTVAYTINEATLQSVENGVASGVVLTGETIFLKAQPKETIIPADAIDFFSLTQQQQEKEIKSIVLALQKTLFSMILGFYLS